MKKHIKFMVIVFCAIMLSAGAGFSADFPEELKIIVPFGAGGSNDRQARGMLPFLQKYLTPNIVIENRPGGATVVGTKSFLQMKNDGSNLLYTAQPHLSGGILRTSQFGIDDLEYLDVNHVSPMCIAANKDSSFRNIEQVLEAIKSGEKLKMAVVPGTFAHIIAKQLPLKLNGSSAIVPYNGGGTLRAAVIGGHVDLGLADLEGTLAAAQGEIVPLAITDDERHPMAPDVPTLNEALLKIGSDVRFEPMGQLRFFAVKKGFKEAYPDRYKTLVDGIRKAVEDPDFQAWCKQSLMTMKWISPDKATVQIKNAHETMTSFKEIIVKKK